MIRLYKRELDLLIGTLTTFSDGIAENPDERCCEVDVTSHDHDLCPPELHVISVRLIEDSHEDDNPYKEILHAKVFSKY